MDLVDRKILADRGTTLRILLPSEVEAPLWLAVVNRICYTVGVDREFSSLLADKTQLTRACVRKGFTFHRDDRWREVWG